MKYKKITIKLSKKQIKKIWPLWNIATNDFDKGRPGMILGQAFCGFGGENARFTFIPYKEALKILKIHNPKEIKRIKKVARENKERSKCTK